MKDIRSLIEKKQNARALSSSEIQAFVQSLGTKSSPPDYQIASLLAFIFCKGLDAEETRAFTSAMRFSGSQVNRKKFSKDAWLMDKHSTGGVGDKISLPLLPWVLAASESIYIPMIAGRGLGHTGGTIDKLDSIPGCRTEFSPSEFERALLKRRGVFSSQSTKIAPADRVLYALRDVTGTVASTPLIVASILSKKLSESLDYLLLDVKFGDAAFMPNVVDSEKLAIQLSEVARLEGLICDAYQTNMQAPLGSYSGNRLEILETEMILKGEGPRETTDLSFQFAKAFLERSGVALGAAEDSLFSSLKSGRALEVWEKIIEAQGGKLSRMRAQIKSLPSRLKTKTIKAQRDGFLFWKARSLGWALVSLGGGRRQKTDKIQYDVGFYHPIPQGGKVSKGQEILRLYHLPTQNTDESLRLAKESFEIREEGFSDGSLIRRVFRDERTGYQERSTQNQSS